VFCPNCGTQNDSAASPCKKCGFKLSGVSAPKFKGTMMLNSEQSVQELIEEHKRKREEAGESEAAPAAPEQAPPPPPVSPSAAPPSGLKVQKGVLQPPRVVGSKRRMGGTMLGVAPQAGGIIPPTPVPSPIPEPHPELTAPPPPAASAAPQATPERVPAEPELVSPPLRPDPLAGTVAMPMIPSPAAPAAGRTQALEATPEAVRPPAQQHSAPSPDPWAREPEATRGTAQMPEVELREPERKASDSIPSPSGVPRRVRPIEVFLIIATCGLYGLVLLLRQRKPPA